MADTVAMSGAREYPADPAWNALHHASPDVKARWHALWLEEYRSMRSESEQARNAQQTILQWSLGSFAAIIAGSLVMFQGSTSHDFKFSGEAGTILLYIFGLGLPGLGVCAYLVWWGEFLRMERAGRYTRGLEVIAQRLAGDDINKVPPPLQWEHYLAGPVKTKGRNKQMIGYVGTVGIYFGFSVSALIMFISLVFDHVYRLGRWSALVRGLSLVWPAVYVGVFVLITWYLKRLADRQSRQGVLLEDALPAIKLVSPGQAAADVPISSSSTAVAPIELGVAPSGVLPVLPAEQAQAGGVHPAVESVSLGQAVVDATKSLTSPAATQTGLAVTQPVEPSTLPAREQQQSILPGLFVG